MLVKTYKGIEMKREKDTRELFVKAVKKIMAEKGLRQKELADDLNMTANDVSGFLNLNASKNFSEARREQMAEYLGYSYIDLLIMGNELEEGTDSKEKISITPQGSLDTEKIINDYMEMNKFLREEISAMRRQFDQQLEWNKHLERQTMHYLEKIKEVDDENKKLLKEKKELEEKLKKIEEQKKEDQETEPLEKKEAM
jgi:transcriptional regulator with XRE-family HTH domain